VLLRGGGGRSEGVPDRSRYGCPGGEASWMRPSPTAGTVSGLVSLSVSWVMRSSASAAPSSSGVKRTLTSRVAPARLLRPQSRPQTL